jgi:hypothetical protein
VTRALGTAALMFAALVLMAYACTGCGGRAHGAPATGPEYVYSHTVQGAGVDCGAIYTTDPRVLLQCEPGAELVRVCAYDGDTTVDVYALPGAGDGTPFGVASFVECVP